jgi:hypothetical protein
MGVVLMLFSLFPICAGFNLVENSLSVWKVTISSSFHDEYSSTSILAALFFSKFEEPLFIKDTPLEDIYRNSANWKSSPFHGIE